MAYEILSAIHQWIGFCELCLTSWEGGISESVTPLHAINEPNPGYRTRTFVRENTVLLPSWRSWGRNRIQKASRRKVPPPSQKALSRIPHRMAYWRPGVTIRHVCNRCRGMQTWVFKKLDQSALIWVLAGKGKSRINWAWYTQGKNLRYLKSHISDNHRQPAFWASIGSIQGHSYNLEKRF